MNEDSAAYVPGHPAAIDSELDVGGIAPELEDCISCGEGSPENECPSSRRPCGHHCDCSWVHDHCHWCDREFGGCEV